MYLELQFILFLDLFKARISERNNDACDLFLADHYIKNDKDFGNVGLDYETSKSYKVRKMYIVQHAPYVIIFYSYITPMIIHSLFSSHFLSTLF